MITSCSHKYNSIKETQSDIAKFASFRRVLTRFRVKQIQLCENRTSRKLAQWQGNLTRHRRRIMLGLFVITSGCQNKYWNNDEFRAGRAFWVYKVLKQILGINCLFYILQANWNTRCIDKYIYNNNKCNVQASIICIPTYKQIKRRTNCKSWHSKSKKV